MNSPIEENYEAKNRMQEFPDSPFGVTNKVLRELHNAAEAAEGEEKAMLVAEINETKEGLLDFCTNIDAVRTNMQKHSDYNSAVETRNVEKLEGILDAVTEELSGTPQSSYAVSARKNLSKYSKFEPVWQFLK
jgi:hypothetical protein